MTLVDAATANRLLSQLVGQSCSHSTINYSTGAQLLIGFGKMRPMSGRQPSTGPIMRGDWLLMLLDGWVIRHEGALLVDSSSDYRAPGDVRGEPGMLEGMRVLSVLHRGSAQLRIEFERGVTLQCDAVGIGFDELLWYLTFPDDSMLRVFRNRVTRSDPPNGESASEARPKTEPS
jgi:hypothetical protein